MVIFLLGCSKANHETIAFVGDESGMKSCYQIYPRQYFPYNYVDPDTLFFPPDIVGEYEMNGEFVECTYEFYMGNSYKPITTMNAKTLYIIVKEQVNGMAKMRFATKKNGEYSNWHDVDAFIYGNVHDNNSKDFIICYEFTEYAGDFTYDRGNIIKGTIEENGIRNIHSWSIIKDRTPKEDKQMIFNYNGYEHYKADFAERK